MLNFLCLSFMNFTYSAIPGGKSVLGNIASNTLNLSYADEYCSVNDQRNRDFLGV